MIKKGNSYTIKIRLETFLHQLIWFHMKLLRYQIYRNHFLPPFFILLFCENSALSLSTFNPFNCRVDETRIFIFLYFNVTKNLRYQTSDTGHQTSDNRPQTSETRLRTSDFRLQILDLRLQTSDVGHRTPDVRQ